MKKYTSVFEFYEFVGIEISVPNTQYEYGKIPMQDEFLVQLQEHVTLTRTGCPAWQLAVASVRHLPPKRLSLQPPWHLFQESSSLHFPNLNESTG